MGKKKKQSELAIHSFSLNLLTIKTSDLDYTMTSYEEEKKKIFYRFSVTVQLKQKTWETANKSYNFLH